MTSKGFVKSENPDLLVNIFTKEREEVNVNQFNAGWGYGWDLAGALLVWVIKLQFLAIPKELCTSI